MTVAVPRRAPAPPRPASPEYEVVTSAAGLAALREEWTCLYEESRPRNPFLSHAWAEACCTHLCGGRGLFVLTARIEGRLVAVAPLRRDYRFGFRVLRALGEGYSPYGAWLSGACEEGNSLLLQGLRELRGEWDLMLLYQLAEPFTRLHGTSVPPGLCGGIRKSRWRGAAYLSFPGDWQDLLRTGPGWLKKTGKQARKLEREGVRVVRLQGTEAAACITDVAAIEEKAWQGRYGRTGDESARSRVLGLLEGALRGFGDRGEMELWLAYVDGTPAAYEINFLLPDRIWLYRGAYDEAYARLSIGSVLDWHSIQQSWEEGRREYDFMSGDEPYKAQRTDQVRALHQLCLYPATPRGRLAYASLVAPRTAVERWGPARAAVSFAARAVRSPRSLFPGSGVKRSRIH